MAIQYQIPGQNLTYKLPEVGEVFQQNGSVYKRIGNTIVKYDGSLPNAGNLPSYNLGDISYAFKQLGYGRDVGESKDASLFTPTPVNATNEVFTQGVRNDNPNSATITSNLAGTINQGTSLQDALARGTLSTASTDPNRVINETTGQIASQMPLGLPNTDPLADFNQLMVNPSLQSSGDYSRNPDGTISYQGQVVAQQQSTNPAEQFTQYATPSQATPQTTSPELDDLLSNSNLSADQKEAVSSIYDAITNNDADMAERIKAAMKSATEFSDPYFKAQIRLVTDALDRGLSSKEGDLAYKETQLSNTLKDLNDDIAIAKDNLSFEQTQELKGLAQSYEKTLENTRQDLASVGKSSSSIRSKAEGLMKQNYEGLVESTNRAFNTKTTTLANQGSRTARDTSLEIDRLRKLTEEGKLDLLRTAEEKVGSTGLADLGYQNLLGGVGGDIERQKVLDATSFANSFIF